MNVKQLKDTYVSRKGQRLKVSLADPQFKDQCKLMLTCINFSNPQLAGKLKGLLSVMRDGIKYDAGKHQEVYQPMRVTAETYSDSAGALFYSTPVQTSYPVAGLGYVLRQNGAVCREKAMYTHLMLAALGIRSHVVNGDVEDAGVRDGHTWVTWIDPPSMRIPGPVVIDGTWGQLFVDGAYYDKYVKGTINSDEYFQPAEGHLLDGKEVYKAFQSLSS